MATSSTPAPLSGATPRRLRAGALTSGLRRATATFVAFLLAAMTIVSLPVASQAAELDAITGVTITESTDPITVYQQLQINATWAVADSAVAGDTFSLTFPTDPQLSGFVDTITLKDPLGAAVATCVVTATGFKCTLTSYADTRSNVSGTLSFFASFTQESSNTEVTFLTGSSATIPVTIPGGVGPQVGDGTIPHFDEPTKWGWVTDGTNLTQWHIFLPSADVVGHDGTPITLTDTIDPRLVVDLSTLSIVFVLDSDWNDGKYGDNYAWLDEGTDYALSPGPAANQLQITLGYAPAAPGTFHIQYRAPLPAERADGDTYVNTIAGTDLWSTQDQVRYRAADGDGNGDETRSLALTKTVDGPAPAGRFTFSVTCTTDGVALATFPRTLTLAADETAYIQSIPVGSVCVITETDSLGATSVTYSDSNTVTVTAESPALIQVTATNHFVVPPVDVTLGSIAVTKSVAGAAASLVPAATSYPVAYSYILNGTTVTGTLPVLAGGTATLSGLPVGTVVTFTEPAIPTVTNVTWGSPTFTVAGSTTAVSVDVTVVAATTSVTVTNTAARTQVTGVLSSSGTAAPSSYVLASSGMLATTGASSLAALLAAAGLTVVGLSLVGARRARSAR